MTKAANIGATLTLVPSPSPMKAPARMESLSLPSRATLYMKYTATTVKSASSVSTAKKWLSWMCITARAAIAAASTPTLRP